LNLGVMGGIEGEKVVLVKFCKLEVNQFGLCEPGWDSPPFVNPRSNSRLGSCRMSCLR
jgi:hypothetical protein